LPRWLGYPNVTVVAVIEPNFLVNLFTNLGIPGCGYARDVYLRSVAYALQQLSAVGVNMYIDGGHAGGVLSWPANILPTAQLLANLYSSAGKSQYIRGLATNIANYNALSSLSSDPVMQGNDEIHYINALAPYLQSQGFPAHFIVEQGRSGRQNIRNSAADWCNVQNAGFGIRPTTNTSSSYSSFIFLSPFFLYAN
jgi:cellulose 1,4-beta-cellobiosidase